MLTLGLGMSLFLSFEVFSQYYPELFLPRNITVCINSRVPLMFTCPAVSHDQHVPTPTTTAA